MLNEENLASIRKITESLFELMNFQLTVSVTARSDEIQINVTGNDRAYLITDNGETVLSLQYILSKLIRQKFPEFAELRILLETDGYMFHHEQSLRRLAYRSAQEVRRGRRSIKLPPMNPYERRIIHTEVARNGDLDSISEGYGFLKKVVIHRKFQR
ncbi:MAG: hypothetical protein C5B54_01630 [Acidobacteria bacterium]|nr:MAG: hypothetical protein C5B54_01630 [Acidobacteriota bacterium]